MVSGQCDYYHYWPGMILASHLGMVTSRSIKAWFVAPKGGRGKICSRPPVILKQSQKQCFLGPYPGLKCLVQRSQGMNSFQNLSVSLLCDCFQLYSKQQFIKSSLPMKLTLPRLTGPMVLFWRDREAAVALETITSTSSRGDSMLTRMV